MRDIFTKFRARDENQSGPRYYQGGPTAAFSHEEKQVIKHIEKGTMSAAAANKIKANPKSWKSKEKNKQTKNQRSGNCEALIVAGSSFF